MLISETLHKRVQARCRKLGVYVSGMLGTLASLFVDGQLTPEQEAKIVDTARINRMKRGRGWTREMYDAQEKIDE